MFFLKSGSAWAILLLTYSLSGKGEGLQRIGLLWAENQLVTPIQRQKYLSEVKDWVENEWGARLVQSHAHLEIPLSVVHLEQKKQDLLQLAQESIQDELQINRKMAQLPKGIFSPEIQQVKIKQAQYWWKKKNYSKMEQLLTEARGLHPFGEVLFDQENNHFLPVEWEVFESVAVQWLSKSSRLNKCGIKFLGGKNDVAMEANGFPIEDLKDWIYPGTFLFQWKDGKGKRKAQLLRCVGKEELTLGEGVSEKVKQVNRIDQFLRYEVVPMDSYLLIVPHASRFELFSYQKEKGLALVTQWRKNLDSFPVVLKAQYQVPEKKPSEWYNKSSTWWWLGGMLLAASAAYFVDESLSQEQRVGWKVRIIGLP